MRLKPLQIPSVPIKPHKALTYHQVGLCTLLYSRWNQTTEFSNSPSFSITDSGPVKKILDTL